MGTDPEGFGNGVSGYLQSDASPSAAAVANAFDLTLTTDGLNCHIWSFRATESTGLFGQLLHKSQYVGEVLDVFQVVHRLANHAPQIGINALV